MPVFTVFAGLNGAGKSTIIKSPEFEGRRTNLLEVDAIAKRQNSDAPSRAAIAAAREVILRTSEYIRTRQSFAIETTLASRRTLVTMRAAQREGFLLELVYIGLVDPELCIQRVRQRVAQGGHDVSDADVRRRYSRSLTNLASALSLADQVVVYDNSEHTARKVFEVAAGVIQGREMKEPDWVTLMFDQIPRKRK